MRNKTFEFRLTFPTGDKDPSDRSGTYLLGSSVREIVKTAVFAYNLREGTLIDVQIWKCFQNGEQIITPGKGCPVFRFRVMNGTIRFVERYEHP